MSFGQKDTNLGSRNSFIYKFFLKGLETIIIIQIQSFKLEFLKVTKRLKGNLIIQVMRSKSCSTHRYTCVILNLNYLIN